MTGMVVVVVVMAAYFGGKCFSSLLRARVLTQNLVKKWWSRIEKGDTHTTTNLKTHVNYMIFYPLSESLSPAQRPLFLALPNV